MTILKKKKPLVFRTDVYQGNPLINARKEFDTVGMKIFLLGLRGLNPHFSKNDKVYDTEFSQMFISTAQLTELFGGNTWYLHELKKECDKLFNAIIEFNYESGGFRLLHLFDELRYKPKEGLYIQFDPKMKPHLLDLFETKGYTKLDVEQLFVLTSPYALRLVELMLQYQNMPEMKMRQEIVRNFTIEDLRFELNVPKNAYAGRLNNFRDKVLDSPINEINEKTIYQMSYKVEKSGVKVVGFEFRMDIRAVPIKGVRTRYGEAAIKKLLSLGFSQTAAKEIFDKCNSAEDCFKRIDNAQKILARQKRRNRSPVENEIGFLRKAILENWNPWTFSNKAAQPKTKTKTQKETIAENQEKKISVFPQKITPPRANITPEQAEIIHCYLASGSEGRKGAVAMLKSAGWSIGEFLEKFSS